MFTVMSGEKKSGEKTMSQVQRIGLLEVIQYVLAVVLVVAVFAWNQYLIPPLVASVLAIPYAIWRRIQRIEWEE